MKFQHSQGKSCALANLLASWVPGGICPNREIPDSILSLPSLSLLTEDVSTHSELHPPPTPHAQPCPKKQKMMPKAKEWFSHQRMSNEDRSHVKLSPKLTPWFISHVLSPDLKSKKFHQKFRHRFRMKHSSFLTLLGWVKQSDDFAKWTRTDFRGPVPPSPVELLLLGSLRHLGR